MYVKKGNKGGKRPGSGRKKGVSSEFTKRRLKMEQTMKDRIVRATDALLSSQMGIAKGVTMLFVLKTSKDGKRGKPELIEDQATIEDYLEGKLDNKKDEHYFMTTSKPDNRAIDSLLDRTYGKSRESVDVTSKGERIVGGVVNIIRNKK